MAKRDRLAIFGYIGFGNLGDEATLSSLLMGLAKWLPTYEPVVLSRSPYQTEKDHKTHTFSRTNFKTVYRILRRCRLLIGCGGSLLQDATSLRSLIYYTALILTAKRLDCKVALIGQGLGPLERRTGQWLTSRALNTCDLITFRDANALAVARSIAPNSDATAAATVTADIAFGLSMDFKVSQTPICGPSRIGIVLRPWHDIERIINHVGAALNMLHSQANAQFILIPFQGGTDEVIHRHLLSKLPSKATTMQPAPTISTIPDQLRQCDLLIGMRLHSLIFASMTGVPFVAIDYDPKTSAFAQQIEPQCIIPAPLLTSENLLQTINWTLSNGKELRDRINYFAGNQKRLACVNFELLAKL